MSYSESLAIIRNARKDRDRIRGELYALRMKLIALKKLQKKAQSADIVEDEATQAMIMEVQENLKASRERLAILNFLLDELRSKKERASELEKQIDAAEVELQLKKNKLEGIQNEIDNAELTDKQKEDLENQLEQLEKEIRFLVQKISELKAEFEVLHGFLGRQSSEEQLQTDLREQENLVSQLQLRVDAVVGKVHPSRKDETENIDALSNAIRNKAIEEKDNDKNVFTAISGLFKNLNPRDPAEGLQALMNDWIDQAPIALLPVRMETKFSHHDDQQELMVRIYPDEIALVTHEKTLTEKEIEFGVAHWKVLFEAEEGSQKKKESWQELAERFGLNRAAWVAKQTKPKNWKDRIELAGVDALEFPLFDSTKPDQWTEAPHTKVLPDRFVILGYRQNKQVYINVGAQLNDIIVLGPAPVGDNDKPTVTRDPLTNRISYGDDFAWVADFDLAVQKGMGFRIGGDHAKQGFDQLLVLGLKWSGDKDDNQLLFEDLLENHRYSQNGLALVPQGTPTNNTEEADAGFSVIQETDDISKLIESDPNLFDTKLPSWEACDGRRLADYFGISYPLMQSVHRANTYDHKEAVAVNAALYAGTLGYFMQKMLNDVLEEESLSKLRRHFVYNVTGRGPLPTLKIGEQPYGIVVTSHFGADAWKSAGNQFYLKHYDRFYPKMHEVLTLLAKGWKEKITTVSSITKTGDAGETLMKVLGLQPSSVEYFQRVGYSYDYLKNLEEFGFGGKYFGDVMMMFLEGAKVRGLLKSFGYQQKNEDGTSKPLPLLPQLIFQHFHKRLDPKNIIDEELLSEQKTIKTYSPGLNYIHWLLANASDESKLLSQDFGDAQVPNSLLYMMLLNALLLESSNSINKYLKSKEIDAPELVRSRKFMNISTAASVSPWEVFRTPVNKLVRSENSEVNLYQFVHKVIGDAGVSYNLDECKWALDLLKDLPTARLERAFAEHIDTVSYRLDAWQTSLFDLRLQQQRNITHTAEQREMGLYLGAYGYLENVKPGNKRIKIKEEQLHPGLREKKENVFVERGNGGYVQAPTLNHATAAAILRNGYLTHASKADNQVAAVNLSSERVRRAKSILEGIQNGQTLEALLGYQFERGLHDWSTRTVKPVILNQLKPLFRQTFPIKKTKVPQEGKTTGPEEITDDFHVVNGLALAQVTSGFPYGVTGLPSLNTDQVSALEAEKKNLENTLDALRDVLTSESAYQLALGNFDRAAAVMQSVSNANMIPDIEVINSARSSQLSLTNRVVIHFHPGAPGNPWSGVDLTQRALTEPGLNFWLGGLLGNPSKIECMVRAVNREGVVLLKNGSRIEGKLSLAQLRIQPLDFVLLIRNKLEAHGSSELEARIRYFFCQDNGLEDNVIIKIFFDETSDPADLSIRSFREILPFANYLRELVCGSKFVTARDFEPASKIKTSQAANPGNVDVEEMKKRVRAAIKRFEDVSGELGTAVSNAAIKTDANISALRNKLKEFADAGFHPAFPESAVGFDDQQLETLIVQGNSVIHRFNEIKKEYTKSLPDLDNPGAINTRVDLMVKMTRSLYGNDFVLIPRFRFNNMLDVTKAFAEDNQLQEFAKTKKGMALPVEEWLHGVSLVRKKMHTLEMVRLMNDTFNSKSLDGSPMQLPYRAKDTWLAVEFPEGTTIDHDTLCFVQYSYEGYSPLNDQCGLMVDDWVEIIPNKEEVSGIGFNYNQPNSAPPQAILLAVSPGHSGTWSWPGLVSTVLETIERAKQRAVEPDDVDKIAGGITTLLPATLAEFSTSPFTHISLDYLFNIRQVREEANYLSALKDNL